MQIEISRISCIYKANIEFTEQKSTFTGGAYTRMMIFSYLPVKRSSQRNSVQKGEKTHLQGPRERKRL